jgi:hypothetical protein
MRAVPTGCVAIVLSLATAGAYASPGAAELLRPRCWVAPAGKVACPRYVQARPGSAAGHDRDWQTLVIGGEGGAQDEREIVVAYGAASELASGAGAAAGVEATLVELREGRFTLAPPPRALAPDRWLAGTPRVRLYVEDPTQRSVGVEVDCGQGRLARGMFTLGGDRFWVQRFPRRAVFALLAEQDAAEGRRGARGLQSAIVDPGALCAAQP